MVNSTLNIKLSATIRTLISALKAHSKCTVRKQRTRQMCRLQFVVGLTHDKHNLTFF